MEEIRLVEGEQKCSSEGGLSMSEFWSLGIFDAECNKTIEFARLGAKIAALCSGNWCRNGSSSNSSRCNEKEAGSA